MLAFEAALERLLTAIPGPTVESAISVELEASTNRYLAESPRSLIDLPPFDNSAMDGWAVNTADLKQIPSSLLIQGSVAAGEAFAETLQSGCAIRVFTGSPLPSGADAVVMQEDASVSEPGFVQIREPARPWEFVRLRGEDVRRGTALMRIGARLGPAQLALLAAAGVNSARIFPSIRVAILPNGSELVTPGQPLPPGGVYECNALAISELVRSTGAIPRRLPTPRDDRALIEHALQDAFAEAEVVVTAGGASVGDHDLIKPAFEQLGGKLDFWRIDLRPGKPFFFGTIPSAGRLKYLFGVPGNPVSAFVTTVLLVLPALRKLLGAAEWSSMTHPGHLVEPIANATGRRHFVRVVCDRGGGVKPSGPQASHFVGSLAAANGLVDISPGAHWEPGKLVQVLRWTE